MKRILSVLLLGLMMPLSALPLQPLYEEVFPAVKLSKPLWMSEVPGHQVFYLVNAGQGKMEGVPQVATVATRPVTVPGGFRAGFSRPDFATAFSRWAGALCFSITLYCPCHPA